MRYGLICFIVLFSASGIVFAQTDDYFPLKVGNYWSYRNTPVNNSDFKLFEDTQSVKKLDVINDKDYYQISNRNTLNADANSSVWQGKDEKGNIVAYALGTNDMILAEWETPLIIIPCNISVGETWENRIKGFNEAFPDSVLYAVCTNKVVSINETVTVPAGTFENCLKIYAVDRNYEAEIVAELVTYYAKGVGRVLTLRNKTGGNDHKSELTEYKIIE